MFKHINTRLILLYFSFFILMISSSIKQTESFFQGSARQYSYLVNLIASNSKNLLILALLVLLFFSAKKLYETESIVKINSLVITFVLLKIWLLFVWIMYDVFKVEDLVLSIAIVLVTSSSLFLLDERKKIVFFKLAILIGIFIIFFNIVNYNEILVNPENVFWKGRLYGTTNHPNFLGGYLSVGLPFLLYLFTATKTKTKLLVIFFIITTIVLILLSGSRTAMAGMFISFLCWFYFLNGFKSVLKAFLPFTVLAFLFINLDILSYFTDFNVSRLTMTQNTRAAVFDQLITIFYNNYLIGNPLLVTQTSSSYLSVMARGGLIGLAILLALLAQILYKLSKIKKNDFLTSAYAASLIVFLFYAFFEGVLVENFSLGQLFFVFFLLYIGEKKINEAH